MKITAVDIDEVVEKIATSWFDLVKDERMEVVVDDGIKYIVVASEREKLFDAILFDVDSKDTSMGLSCPPKSFLDTKVLRAVAKCLKPRGIFILNVVCRDKNLRPAIVDELKANFTSLTSINLEIHLNEIFICSKNKLDDDDMKNLLLAATKNLNRQATLTRLSNEKIVQLSDLVKSLNLQC